MKNASFLFTAVVVGAIALAGSSCQSVPFSSNKTAACSYQGSSYEANTTFPASDTCNTCRCNDDGKVTCTEIACDANPAACKSDDDCKRLDLDQSFCTTGEWDCVNNQCELVCNVGGRLAP